MDIILQAPEYYLNTLQAKKEIIGKNIKKV